MKVYVGQTRSSTLIPRLVDYGWGEMTCRGELPPRRRPWAYDNGAFGDWKAQRPFDADGFRRDVDRIAAMDSKPDFLVAPDIVTAGRRSLEFSAAWAQGLHGIAPRYLALQDGMTPYEVHQVAEEFEGFFVGGSLPWKIREGAAWVAIAHYLGKPCHIGRVGTGPRVQWAKRIKADSIDSALPLWSEDNLARFILGLRESEQYDLPWEPTSAFWRGFGITDIFDDGGVMAQQPAQLDQYDHEYKPHAWEQYSLAELGQWVHLFAKRAGHRADPTKRAEDIQAAKDYHAMMGAKLDALETE